MTNDGGDARECDVVYIIFRQSCNYNPCYSIIYGHRDDVIKRKHFPRYWPFVRGIPRSPVNSPYKGQWRGALMFSLICNWGNSWANNGDAGDLRRHRAHYDVIVMVLKGRGVSGPVGNK